MTFDNKEACEHAALSAPLPVGQTVIAIRTVLIAERHDLVHVVGVVDDEGGEVLDVDADVGPLLDLESL